MNVEGADVEQHLGRSLMPRLHAGFSLGTVAGAGIGAAAAAVDVPLAAQVIGLAVLAPLSMAVATRRFLGVVPVAKPVEENAARGFGARDAWREPRTLLVGLMVLGFAFTEGSANDWMAVAMVDGYGTGAAVGALGFGVFVTAMTVGRLFGGTALDRFGRVPVLRATAALGLAGLLLVLLGGSPQVAMAGAVLWGFGAALGFPVGMSAGADDPARAAVRVSVVSSIGYTAFLAGPPLIGLLAEHVGILRALFVVVGALTLGLAAAAPPGRSRRARRRRADPVACCHRATTTATPSATAVTVIRGVRQRGRGARRRGARPRRPGFGAARRGSAYGRARRSRPSGFDRLDVRQPQPVPHTV